ncbi:MAG: UbiA family prenyltransferase [Candidatus Aenigmarchaeota archaeon]|nr:UbiA family prenyltransferase [Candidatus Aenigmarchaeota archaeon]
MDLVEMLGMMRPGNCLMAAAGALIGALIAIGGINGLFSAQFMLVALAVVAITGAGNVINDYFDVEADKVNRPRRPIPSGAVSRRGALVFAVLLFVLGNFCALTISWACFFIAILNTALLVVYSWTLQHKVFIGNITIGYLVGSVFFFGAAAFFNDRIGFALVLTALAMMVNVSREIVKDMEDMEGDRKSFLKRIASSGKKKRGERFSMTDDGARLRYNERMMIVIALFCLLVAVVLSAIPYYFGYLRASYFVVVLVADALFVSCIYSVLREQRKKKGYTRISRRLKIGMFIAMVAFIAGVIF